LALVCFCSLFLCPFVLKNLFGSGLSGLGWLKTIAASDPESWPASFIHNTFWI